MESGARLGPYEVLKPLGAGGMGEVYLARDTRLGREVAIKVLPEVFAADPERLARFEQEARAAAALNHPNIAVVHDIGEEGGIHYMVQEYLEGQTLREVLDSGPVPVKKALAIAHDVAEALRVAHSANVVHRDLKPDNVFLSPDGHAKILDFGLAKLVETTPASADASMSPTAIGTMAGTIMGTAGYMAPEQIEGGDVDRRTDLFAFGCVLYEIVAGQRAFAGQSVPDTLSKILHREPDRLSTAAAVPADLERILAKCLRKDPAERYQYADDLLVDLRAVDTTAPVAGDADSAVTRPGKTLRLPGLAAALAAATTLGVIAGQMFLVQPANPGVPEPVRARLGFDPAASLARGRPVVPDFAIAPDGGSVVFAARGGSDADAPVLLFRRDLTEVAAVPIRGTEGARWPFFAPDGQRIAFVTDTRQASSIQSVPAEGGLPTTHVANLWPFGVSWGEDGFIYYTPDYRSGLWRVDAGGGEPEVVAELAAGDYSYRHARRVPGTDLIVYTALDRPDMCRWETARIMARSLASGDSWVVHQGGADPRVLPTGHMLFNDGTTVMAMRFDASNGTASGTPIPVLENVMASQCGPVPFVELGMAMVDVAADGKVVYLTGGTLPAQRLELVAAAADGGSRVLSLAHVALSPRVAPDGRRVLVGSPDGLLLVDPDRGQADLTIADGYFATFSPDGAQVAYMAANTIGRRASDGTGEPEVLLEVSTETYVADWDTDGTMILVRSEGDVSRARWGVWAFDPDADPDDRLRRLFGDEGTQLFPTLSPDERWLAYTDRTQAPRVFITSYPDLQGRYLVGAGTAPAWSADGGTLYFQDPGDDFGSRARMLLASDTTDPRSPGVAVDYMQLDRYAWSSPVRGYDVFPDGRVVYSQMPQESLDLAAGTVPGHMELIVNWFTELERLLPAGR